MNKLRLLLPFVLFFLSLYCSNALAAPGDVKSVVVDAEGWFVEVEIESFKKDGTLEIFDSSDVPNITAQVVSEGFDSNGNPILVTRSVHATKVIRKKYPDQSDLDYLESDGNLFLKLSLNEPIYNDDKNGGAGTSGTNPTFTFEAGWYTDTGPGGSAQSSNFSNVEAVNNSNLDYPKVVGNWAWPDRYMVESDFLLEAVFFHKYAQQGRPVVAVQFDATDDSLNSSTTQIVNNLIVSDRPDANSVLVYSATMDIDALNSGELIHSRFRAYPWIGDQDSVLDSNQGSTLHYSPEYGPAYLLNDKDNTYGRTVAFVDLGGSSSGVVGEEGDI